MTRKTWLPTLWWISGTYNFHWTNIWQNVYPANIYLFKVNIRNTRKRCEICSKLMIKTPERRQWRRFGVSIVNFDVVLVFFFFVNCEYIWHHFLVFPLLTLNKQNVSWVTPCNKWFVKGSYLIVNGLAV